VADRPDIPHVQIAIIGGGFAGIGAAIRLRQAGIDDFVIFERADDIGGVWRDNQYPGCACDVESHLYSFAVAPNAGWSRAFSPQPEIWAYLRGCAERFGVMPHVRLGQEVRAMTWDDDAQRWRIDTVRGSWTASLLVAAPGGLSEPSVPALPGTDTFAGAAFHSARWRHDVALTGRAVAVIGTGASAIQLVPRIQPDVGRLLLFQRTPPWIMPSRDRARSARARRFHQRFPVAQRAARAWIRAYREALVVALRHPRSMRLLERVALRHLAAQVPDATLRDALTPRYTMGCKRILVSDEYLPALTRPNVEVVTASIAEVRPRAIVTTDGVEHPVDVIVFATGFHVADFPFARHVRGRDGRSLGDVWAGSPQAHVGTTVAGFPNLFILQGPHTGLGHTSVLLMQEAQVEHLLGALTHMRRTGAATIEPRAEAQAAFVAAVERDMQGTVWTAGGCRSWYIDETGRNSTLWPRSTWAFQRRVARLRPEEYVTQPQRVALR
jgi:cation diffusion facilitator CzcD-associated flavoprotein CzcO